MSKTTFTLRLPDDVTAALASVAAQNGMSKQKYTEFLIRSNLVANNLLTATVGVTVQVDPRMIQQVVRDTAKADHHAAQVQQKIEAKKSAKRPKTYADRLKEFTTRNHPRQSIGAQRFDAVYQPSWTFDRVDDESVTLYEIFTSDSDWLTGSVIDTKNRSNTSRMIHWDDYLECWTLQDRFVMEMEYFHFDEELELLRKALIHPTMDIGPEGFTKILCAIDSVYYQKSKGLVPSVHSKADRSKMHPLPDTTDDLGY